MATARRQHTSRLQAYLLINIAILTVATWVAWSRQITGLELAVFRAFNGLPLVWYRFFLVVTQAGSEWMLFGVTLLLIGLRRGRLALRIFACGAAAFLLSQSLKLLVSRPRPEHILDEVHVRELLRFDMGFPSSHTAVATACALVLFPHVPKKWRWLCWLWIGLVAFSRIYLGVHAPLDVIGGFAVGVIVVTTSLLVPGKLHYVRKITGLKLQR